MTFELVFEGNDGAAKTPIAKGVMNKLIDLGLTVNLYSPFYLVKNKIPENRMNWFSRSMDWFSPNLLFENKTWNNKTSKTF